MTKIAKNTIRLWHERDAGEAARFYAGSPVLPGGGEQLFEAVDLRALGYDCAAFAASEKATHVVPRLQGRAGD